MGYWHREARRWFEDALEDLRVAELLSETGHYAASCFHSQQAAEKAVKALLYANAVEAGGHSIRALLQEFSNHTGVDIHELLDDARLLDKHYAPPRYPNLHPGVPSPAFELYGREDAEACLRAARNVVDFVRRSLRP